MPVWTAVSHEFDDVGLACGQLLQGVGAGAGALGLLICDAFADCGGLLAALAEKAPFPVVGGSTLAFPMARAEDDISARLLVLEKPGMRCEVAVSAPLRAADAAGQMQALHAEAMEKFGEAPKMWMVFVPRMAALDGEAFIDALFPYAGQVPVFGGMSGADLENARATVFAGGRAYDDRVVLVAIGGAVQPGFAVGARLTIMSEYAPTVTKSEGSIVYEVDGVPFCDYLSRLGLVAGSGGDVKDLSALFQYGPLPVMLQGKLAEDDGVPELRGIGASFAENGSAAFTASVPQGTRVNVGTLQRSDVVKSAEDCLQTLLARMEPAQRQGYAYEALFAVPCVARHFAQVGGEDDESRLLEKQVPQSLAVSSYYAFCEVCPTFGQQGQVHNRTHAESMVMCAL